MSLYKLPKDLLVKLISTIREETIKEKEKEINNKEKQINHYKSLIAEIITIYNINIYKCNFCDRYEVGDDLYYIISCCQCQIECCSEHYKTIEGGLLCINCQKK